MPKLSEIPSNLFSLSNAYTAKFDELKRKASESGQIFDFDTAVLDLALDYIISGSIEPFNPDGYTNSLLKGGLSGNDADIRVAHRLYGELYQTEDAHLVGEEVDVTEAGAAPMCTFPSGADILHCDEDLGLEVDGFAGAPPVVLNIGADPWNLIPADLLRGAGVGFVGANPCDAADNDGNWF